VRTTLSTDTSDPNCGTCSFQLLFKSGVAYFKLTALAATAIFTRGAPLPESNW
jgi:hypothetical protein